MFLSVIGVSSSPSFQCEPAHEHCDGFCQEQGGTPHWAFTNKEGSWVFSN